jgi:hypothetical protein
MGCNIKAALVTIKILRGKLNLSARTENLALMDLFWDIIFASFFRRKP